MADEQGITQELHVLDAGVALSAIERAQIDVQVATSRRFPRDVPRALQKMRAQALQDEEVAATMLYALPRGGKRIEGPSTRLAEVVNVCWGNSRAETDIEAIDGTSVTAVGTFADLENNVAIRERVRRSILDSDKRRFSPDMINVTANAARSIAFRNAVFRGVPRALWLPVYEDARRLAMGSAESLAKRWSDALAWFGKLAVTEEQVLAVLGHKDRSTVQVDDLLVLTGLRTALKDNELRVDEVFPREGEAGAAAGASGPTTSRARALLQQLGGKAGGGKAAAGAGAGDKQAASSDDAAADEEGAAPAKKKRTRKKRTRRKRDPEPQTRDPEPQTRDPEPAATADAGGDAGGDGDGDAEDTTADDPGAAGGQYGPMVAGVLEFVATQRHNGSQFTQVPEALMTEVRTLAAAVFASDEAARHEVLGWVDPEKGPGMSPTQAKVLAAKLRLAQEEARDAAARADLNRGR